MKKKQDYSFLDESINYKTGIKNAEYDIILEESRIRAEQKKQQKLKEEQQKARQEKIDAIKMHAIPFQKVQSEYKVIFIVSIVAFVINIVLSIINKHFLWSNVYNLTAAAIIFLISRHLYESPENEDEEKINNVLRKNIAQILSDIMQYKLPEYIEFNAIKIAEGITSVSAMCFILFSSNNMFFAICSVLSFCYEKLYVVFLMVCILFYS